MPLYYTKENLYKEIDNIRAFLGLSTTDRAGLFLWDALAAQPNLVIQTVPFKTAALRGMLYFGSDTENNVMLLNQNRSIEEQIFDCSHETCHLFLHRGEYRPSFTCMDTVCDHQDSYLEWHANEGGAQLLLPYQDFIPRFVFFLHAMRTQKHCIPSILAKYYKVTQTVVNNRISSLSYEIDQYRNGVALDRIEILSNRQQRKLGISPTCYTALCSYELDWTSEII